MICGLEGCNVELNTTNKRSKYCSKTCANEAIRLYSKEYILRYKQTEKGKSSLRSAQKKHRQTEKWKTYHREYSGKYYKTEKGKASRIAAQEKYQQSSKGKKARVIYRQSPKRKESQAAYSRRYYQTEKGRAIYDKSYHKGYRLYPEKYKARRVAYRKYPVAQECSIEECNLTGERHHPDYSKPLEIIWLCKQHHLEL